MNPKKLTPEEAELLRDLRADLEQHTEGIEATVKKIRLVLSQSAFASIADYYGFAELLTVLLQLSEDMGEINRVIKEHGGGTTPTVSLLLAEIKKNIET